MAKKIHIYQQLKLKNKLRKQEDRDRIMDTESVLMVARWEGSVGEWVRGEGIKKYKLIDTE